MNISLLLIEISQNEKGLYKLTFIINKCTTRWILRCLSPRCMLCTFVFLAYALYCSNRQHVGFYTKFYRLTFWWHQVVLFCVYASTRDHTVLYSRGVIIIAENCRLFRFICQQNPFHLSHCNAQYSFAHRFKLHTTQTMPNSMTKYTANVKQELF